MAYQPSAELVARVLAGETRAIARMLSRAETGAEESRPALDALGFLGDVAALGEGEAACDPRAIGRLGAAVGAAPGGVVFGG